MKQIWWEELADTFHFECVQFDVPVTYLGDTIFAAGLTSLKLRNISFANQQHIGVGDGTSIREIERESVFVNRRSRRPRTKAGAGQRHRSSREGREGIQGGRREQCSRT